MIKMAVESSTDRIPIVLGDLNLNENKKYKTDYAYKLYYELLEEY